MGTALIVEDDAMCREALSAFVERKRFQVTIVDTLKAARKALEDQVPDLALVDLGLPDGDGLRLVDRMANLEGKKPVIIVVTGNLGIDTAIEAMQLGATDYLTKPIDIAKLKETLEKVEKDSRQKDDSKNNSATSSRAKPAVRAGNTGENPYSDFYHESKEMDEIVNMIERVAKTNATVMIIGESGTGKEHIARKVHDWSPRGNGPFVAVNSGAISPNLIESQLFGHEKGSFTGANETHAGFFEQARGGTLFLDEITEMSPELQIKLLRVLETGTVSRVGSTKSTAVDVRIVAATNRDPKDAVAEGKLRHDLYFRLNVFPIHNPPLRDRPDDIRGLANLFLKRLNDQYESEKKIDPKALDALQNWQWPGNIRELKNLVQRAFIISDNVISVELIGQMLEEPVETRQRDISPFVGCSLREVEHQLIIATLEAFRGDKKRAADVLGCSLKTLYNRISEIKDASPTGELVDF